MSGMEQTFSPLGRTERMEIQKQLGFDFENSTTAFDSNAFNASTLRLDNTIVQRSIVKAIAREDIQLEQTQSIEATEIIIESKSPRKPVFKSPKSLSTKKVTNPTSSKKKLTVIAITFSIIMIAVIFFLFTLL
jgi:hypothetical protein